MMFSSHIDMIYKNSALQDIFVKLLFIEYRLSKKIPLQGDEWVRFNNGIHFGSITWVRFNNGIHFGSITKGAKPKYNFFVFVL